MKKILFHNIGLKITTFMCAFVFWQIITGVADPIVTETYRDIPVMVKNEEVITNQGKVYQIIDGNTITVVLKGKTSILRQIKKEDINAIADFESIELSSLVPIQIIVEGFDKAQIEASASPNNLKVDIEDSASKKLPITASAVGQVSEGFVLGEMEVQRDSVTISGPASVVDKITKVEARINVSDIDGDVEIDSELVYYDENNLTIEQTLLSNELSEAVEVKVKIYPIKTLILEFGTEGEPKENHEIVEIIAEPKEIIVYGEKEILDKFDKFSVDCSALDVSGLAGKVEEVIDLLEYIPEGLSLLDETNSLVAVTVQIDEYGTKTLEVPVQSITVHNNPQDLTMEYNAITNVSLTFTGKDDTLEELNVEDVRLSIDLSGCDKAGTYTVSVEVVTIAGCNLIKNITVPIKLK